MAIHPTIAKLKSDRAAKIAIDLIGWENSKKKGNEMNIDDLTIGQAKQLAAMFAATESNNSAAPAGPKHIAAPVVVCTDKRAVVFGYTENVDARPIKLTEARMCLYWSADVGGVFGLAENGPTSGCKISARASELTLEGVTAVFSADSAAVKAWAKAPVQGR